MLSTLLVLPQLPRFRPESSLPVPSGTARHGARAEEAKILLSARTARGAGDGPRSADRSMGPGFHYVNWLLGQQRGRAGGGGGGGGEGGGGEEVKEEEE